MVKFLGNNVFMFVDATFKKVFNIIPEQISLEATKKYLSEYTYTETEASKPEVKAALFTRDIYPTTNCMVYYTPFDKPYQITAYVVYSSLKRKLDISHCNTISEALEKYLDTAYARRETEDGLVYWQKGFCIAYQRLKKAPQDKYPDAFAIEITMFDTQYFDVGHIINTLKQYDKEKVVL